MQLLGTIVAMVCSIFHVVVGVVSAELHAIDVTIGITCIERVSLNTRTYLEDKAVVEIQNKEEQSFIATAKQ